MIKVIKKIYNDSPTLSASTFPFVWIIIYAMLGRLLNELTNFSLTFNFFTSLPLFINAYVVFVIPSWLGLIISKKKSYYIFSIIIWGSFWMVGLVAYVGMNS